MKPISKEEALKKANESFPDFVIQAFNECITESLKDGSATVLQSDVVKRIKKLGNVESCEIYEKHWLDVEDYYRKAGWSVQFDKPGFNESYSAHYVFF